MSIPRHRCRLTIFADYHQFYVWDPEKSGRQAPEQWSDQDVADHAKIAPGVVVICPVRNMEVPVEVGLWDSEPQVIFNVWQHIIEAPLTTAGLIEIHECTGGARRLASASNEATTRFEHCIVAWTNCRKMDLKEKTSMRCRFGGRHVPAYK